MKSNNMKRIIICLVIAVALAACSKVQRLDERAAELCRYIPNPESLESSRGYLTEDFFAVLDTMFYRLPSHEAMDHEYNYWFVTDDGTPLAQSPCEVLTVEQSDDTHAVATLSGEHRLAMEYVGGEWLMADLDDRKADAARYIVINRREQAVRQAISDYLLREIAPQYLQGEICVPCLMIAHEADSCVWGNFLVFWYNQVGDTFKTVSGGSHPGKITLRDMDANPQVAQFERVGDGSLFEPTARRIFGEHYDVFQNMNANESVREAVRREQLQEYIRRQELPVRYYQDYGWPAVEL